MPSADRRFQDESSHEAMQHVLDGWLRPDVGVAADALAADWAWFLRAANRFQSGVFQLGDQDEPTLKQMGMGVSSLTLRARELAARFRALDATAQRLAPSLPGVTEARAKAEALIERAVAHTVPHWPLPDWPLDGGPALLAGCRAVFSGCKACSLAMVGLEQGRRPWQDVLDVSLHAFRRMAWDALGGESDNALLKLLPRLHEEITRRTYQEEAAA